MNYKDLLDELLEIFPDFLETWTKHLDFWEGEERTVGIDLSEFGDFVITKLENDEQYDYKKVFDFIEKLLKTGNEDIEIAATTMFLENIINCSSHGNFEFKKIIKYLGKKSIEYCRAWDEFCSVKTEGLW